MASSPIATPAGCGKGFRVALSGSVLLAEFFFRLFESLCIAGKDCQKKICGWELGHFANNACSWYTVGSLADGDHDKLACHDCSRRTSQSCPLQATRLQYETVCYYSPLHTNVNFNPHYVHLTNPTHMVAVVASWSWDIVFANSPLTRRDPCFVSNGWDWTSWLD